MFFSRSVFDNIPIGKLQHGNLCRKFRAFLTAPLPALSCRRRPVFKVSVFIYTGGAIIRLGYRRAPLWPPPPHNPASIESSLMCSLRPSQIKEKYLSSSHAPLWSFVSDQVRPFRFGLISNRGISRHVELINRFHGPVWAMWSEKWRVNLARMR